MWLESRCILNIEHQDLAMSWKEWKGKESQISKNNQSNYVHGYFLLYGATNRSSLAYVWEAHDSGNQYSVLDILSLENL
jgi:hypothetical protein